ncbi:WXG100 family type VII secretion target [Ruminococcus flavefaciens]|uniref:ESAT-6-like protein n=1 Tax=Ruminococcus flavefaciens 007c TaxID=1341157 RepID=W7UIA0_RUMFL|nr:WXG100 family type VII secretion target [Ruminococcus flavefaciens]EWM54971.1 hypothetical protein RF007C_02970 [Ruminococcus flavefaciens 007c]
MANSIRYSEGTDSVVNTAAKIDSLNDDFYSEYTEFYSTIEGDLMSNWKGEDSETFRQRANDVKPHFESMKDVISEYATFLRNTANAHEARMEDSKDQVGSSCAFGD